MMGYKFGIMTDNGLLDILREKNGKSDNHSRIFPKRKSAVIEKGCYTKLKKLPKKEILYHRNGNEE